MKYHLTSMGADPRRARFGRFSAMPGPCAGAAADGNRCVTWRKYAAEYRGAALPVTPPANHALMDLHRRRLRYAPEGTGSFCGDKR